MKAIMVALFACVTACAIDEAQVTPPAADEPADPSALQSQPLDDRSTLETTTGDNLDSTTASVNCVFVRYCDKPNSSIGTVCVIRTGCGCPIVTQALQDECEADVHALGCSMHFPIAWECQ